MFLIYFFILKTIFIFSIYVTLAILLQLLLFQYFYLLPLSAVDHSVLLATLNTHLLLSQQKTYTKQVKVGIKRYLALLKEYKSV